MIKNYYSLTKPGIIYGNLVTVIGGYFLASSGNFSLKLFLSTILGISLVIACGCVINNCIDRDIDSVMKRTCKRVLVTGLISIRSALLYALILGILGFLLLALNTNKITVIVASVGLFVYVVLYSMWFKRNSIYGTLVGSISGAVPILVGYCAVTNHFGLGAVILFFILATWQMPHSYAIGIRLLDDFSKASIQILPVKKGIYLTKINIVLYVILFSISILALYVFKYVAFTYLVVLGAMSLFWVILSIMGFRAKSNKTWATRMFIYSIIIIVVFSVMIALDGIHV